MQNNQKWTIFRLIFHGAKVHFVGYTCSPGDWDCGLLSSPAVKITTALIKYLYLFISRQPCRFGLSCTRPNCLFTHPAKPSSLKWVSPALHVR